MSWVKVVTVLLKVDIADKKLDVTFKACKKIANAKPDKLKWDDIKFLSNYSMEKALKTARESLKKAKSAQKTKLEYPKNTALRDWSKVLNAAKNYGSGHKRTKVGLDVYAYNLKRYCDDLDGLAHELWSLEDKLMDKARSAQSFANYGDRLHKAFMICAKIPDPVGTMRNAMFFALGTDAKNYKTMMGDVADIYVRLSKASSEHSKDVREEIDHRWEWMTWAKSAAATKDGAILKNKSTKRPKK